MEVQLNVHEWLKLPMDIRARLREIFDIPKSKGTVLEDNTVKSDGTTYEDLSVITVEKMQTFLSSEDPNFVSLFNRVVNTLEDLVELSIVEDLPDPKQLMVDEWVAILNRMKGQAAERSMEDYLLSTISQLFNIKKEQNAEITSSPKRSGRKAKKA